MGLISGIYALKNTADGKVYIGQSVNVAKRLRYHLRSLADGVHYNAHLQSAFHKYGAEVFETQIIERCCAEVLDAREIAWISYHRSTEPDFGYNSDGGGSVGKLRPHPTPESRARMSEAAKGHIVSPETRAKMSAARRMRPAASTETRARLSAALKGLVRSPESRARMSAASKRRPSPSPETRAKLSESSKRVHAAKRLANQAVTEGSQQV